jgi:hypothetical protein
MKRRGRITTQDRAEIEAFRALLAARFNARRCHLCGVPASMVIVGDDAAGRPDRNLCLLHADQIRRTAA